MSVDVQAPPGVEAWWWRLDPDLDYLEGIVPPVVFRDALRDCRAGPFEWWLLNETTGELVRPRCKAPNKCSHCRELGARETVEMIALAAADCPPDLYVVLTTSEFVTRADLRHDLDHIRRAVRRRWPAWEYFCAIEWQRRGALHVNLLTRGVPPRCRDEFMRTVLAVWQRRHRAVRAAQSCQPIRSARHAAAYVHKLGKYLSKDDQAAPPGWRGHRSSQTRGYLGRPASEVREEARLSLRWKALCGRLLARGVNRLEAAFQAAEELERSLLDVWARYPVVATQNPGHRGAGSTPTDGEDRQASLGQGKNVAAHKQVDVRTVVSGGAVARAEHLMAPLVHVPAVGRVAAEQVGCLEDRCARRVLNQSGCLWNNGVGIERADVADDHDRSRINGDRPRGAGVDGEQHCAVDGPHVWPPFVL